MVWSFTERDMLHGLRQRGLPVDSLDDLTTKERSLLHQRADLALTEAALEVVDALATRIRRERGRRSGATPSATAADEIRTGVP
jgi:hypothetical protein